MTRKEVNRCLLENGFHHVWGIWINNENKNFRISVEQNKKKISLLHTKIPNHYNLENKIRIIEKVNGQLVSNYTISELASVINSLKIKFATKS